MKFTRHFLFYSILVSALVSCKNDLKLNAPYKEIPSIYAVLSAQEKTHVIRINKVFLGEEDANVMAKVADSVNYPAGELTVTLERFEAGSNYKKQIDVAPASSNPNLSPEQRRTLVFKESLVQTNPGAFSTTQRVYTADADFHDGEIENPGSYRVSGDYLLTVKNNRTGNVFRAKSSVLDSVAPYGYSGTTDPLLKPYYPYPGGTENKYYIDYSEQSKINTVRFTPNSASIYQVIIRMHFIDSLYPSNINRYVDYEGINLEAIRDARTGPFNSKYLVTEFRGSDIFGSVLADIKQQKLNNDVVGRRMHMVEYLIYGSTQDYQDYMEFVKPSLNISQNKPLYSNFENRDALGIFTFRSRFSVKKNMSTGFITEFQRNSATCSYLFYNAGLSSKGCP